MTEEVIDNNFESKTGGLFKILNNIRKTAERCNRNPNEIILVVVTKTRSIEEILKIYNQGHRIFAENRIQEAQEKIPLLPADIEWHLIGHLQTNKAKKAVELFKMIQSLDSLKLAQILDKEAKKLNKKVNCLIEVKISPEESKFGAAPENTIDLLNSIKDLENINIQGLMGMAPFTDDTNAVRESFRKLKNLFEEIKKINLSPKIQMKWLSMGMSSDYEIAIEEGANMVRIGTAVFES